MKNIHKKFVIFGLSIFLSGSFLITKAESQWKGSVKTEKGVIIVKNPKTPLFSEEYLELEEELLIPESDGKNYFFARPVSLTLDENNNIYVLDSMKANITVFDDQGKFLRSFGRKGAGPGELDGPGDLSIFRRNEIAVKETTNRRITFYSLGGEYKRSLSTARFSSGKMEIDSKGNIFCIVVAFRDGQRRHELQKFDSDLNYIKTFDYRDAPIEKELSVFRAGPCFAILKGDFIAYGSPEKNYEIKIYDNNGTLIKRILKDCSPERIPQKEIDFFFKGRASRGPFYIPEYYSPYYYIFGDSEGRVITFQRSNLIEKVISFDVFSPEGKHLATKNFEADFYEYGCLWRNNKLYVIGKDKEGLPVVRIYRLKWKDGKAF